MVAKVINLAMRGLEVRLPPPVHPSPNPQLNTTQFFWTLLIMALVGNMIASATKGNPSIVNYDMFASVFSMLSLLYLVPATLKEELSFHPLIAIVLDTLNTLFFFVGGVATASYLGVHSCSNAKYTTTNFVTNGAHDTAKRCHEAQASTAFLWFGFAAYAVSAATSALQGRGNVNMRGGVRRGGPAMSQV